MVVQSQNLLLKCLYGFWLLQLPYLLQLILKSFVPIELRTRLILCGVTFSWPASTSSLKLILSSGMIGICNRFIFRLLLFLIFRVHLNILSHLLIVILIISALFIGFASFIFYELATIYPIFSQNEALKVSGDRTRTNFISQLVAIHLKKLSKRPQ